ncbi:MAG TPA: TorF family putative porin [Rhodocyclaceae bacterium]|jgi:uncharacterized protein (TIGR02001 family)|nr:TorF family putative porin [Rhodocyclaceae bacterium]
MKKTILSASVAALLAASAMSAMAEDAPASPLSFNVGVVSDYLFRGVSQTHGDPALQGGIDYAFANGFYVGTWASTISWVKDWQGSGSTEIDFYGGYRGAFSDPDWTYDVGAIAYTYPGHGKANTGLANPTTTEAYASIGYKWLSAKYSYAFSKNFVGWYGGVNTDKSTRGSDYLELNANYDLGEGWTAVGHVGHQNVANSVVTSTGVKSASYSDWKIGVTKDVGFGVVGLAYSGTDVTGSCNSAGTGTNPYCWGTNGRSGVAPTSGFKNVAKDQVVLSFTKTF